MTEENIASTSMNLEEAVRANPSAIVIFQMLDSSIYFWSSEEGEITLPKRAPDGRFHVLGELVLADWSALKKIFTTSLPHIRAGGRNEKLILSPLPRYINSKEYLLSENGQQSPSSLLKFHFPLESRKL